MTMIHSITNSAVLITSPFPSHKHQLGDFFNRHNCYQQLSRWFFDYLHKASGFGSLKGPLGSSIGCTLPIPKAPTPLSLVPVVLPNRLEFTSNTVIYMTRTIGAQVCGVLLVLSSKVNTSLQWSQRRSTEKRRSASGESSIPSTSANGSVWKRSRSQQEQLGSNIAGNVLSALSLTRACDQGRESMASPTSCLNSRNHNSPVAPAQVERGRDSRSAGDFWKISSGTLRKTPGRPWQKSWFPAIQLVCCFLARNYSAVET
jgi:hypothetical protein